MKVAIYGQTYKDDAVEYVGQLLEELRTVRAEIAVELEFNALLATTLDTSDFKTFTISEGLDATFDMFVSFGGDGTILRATTFVS